MVQAAVRLCRKEDVMNKTKLSVFLLLAAFCLIFCCEALADQEGNARWCVSDQYGCWITGDDAGQNYIMFWSESARDLFMGPGSSAGVVTQYPAGRMPLDPAPKPAAPAPAPVDPEEEPEEELTTDRKVSAIIDYMHEKFDIDEAVCRKYAENGNTIEGYVDAVDEVYNMIQEGQEPIDIGKKIEFFFMDMEEYQ